MSINIKAILSQRHCRILQGLRNKRYLTTVTNEEVRKLRNELFSKEKERQLSLTTRIEKIEVQYKGIPKECSLMMNKNLSTPYHCAMHVHEFLCQQSVIAEVNGKFWDMHSPLTEDCELRFLNFRNPSHSLNKVYWRSCSFLLGMIIEKAFKKDYFVELHSWPKPVVESGSFVYDCDLKIANWKPTEKELRVFTVMLWRLAGQDLHFEKLDVREHLALEMFQHNRFKCRQIPEIASQNEENKVRVYRLGDHVDISHGPMMGSTKFLGSTQVTAVYQLDSDTGYRFQALSIPRQLPLNSFAFGILAERAKKFNAIGLKSIPQEIQSVQEMKC